MNKPKIVFGAIKLNVKDTTDEKDKEKPETSGNKNAIKVPLQ